MLLKMKEDDNSINVNEENQFELTPEIVEQISNQID